MIFFLFFFFPFSSQGSPFVGPTDNRTLTRIGFGSCLYDWETELANEAWTAIERSGPDLFLWLGDMIYADYQPGGHHFTKARSLREIRERFESVRSGMERYSVMRKHAAIGIDGTWDDHDCGQDSCDRTYPYLRQFRNLFLDSIGEPPYSTRRMRQSGLYENMLFSQGRLHVIVLDLRSGRDAYNYESIMDEEQWEWLEEVLWENSATALWTLLVSSVTVLPPDIPLNFESWDKFPHERARLLRLLKVTGAQPGTLFLSGDLHWCGVFWHMCPSETPRRGRGDLTPSTDLEGPWWEITSSGFTHVVTDDSPWLGGLSAHSDLAVFQKIQRSYGMLRFNWLLGTVTLELRRIPDSELSYNITLQRGPIPVVSSDEDVTEAHCIAELSKRGWLERIGSIRFTKEMMFWALVGCIVVFFFSIPMIVLSCGIFQCFFGSENFIPEMEEEEEDGEEDEEEDEEGKRFPHSKNTFVQLRRPFGKTMMMRDD